MRRLAVFMSLLAVLFLGSAPAQAAAAVRVDVPLVLMTITDSQGTSGVWQAEFCRIVELETDRVCDVRNEAVGGTQCDYWPYQINALLAEHNPDMVIFACGTNDHINEYIWGEPSTSWSFRATVEAIHAYNPAIEIVPVLIQYADPMLPGSPQILTSWIPITNDRLYVEMLRYPGWFPGIVNWQLIPASSRYLDNTGFHQTWLGQLYMGRIAYDDTHVGMGWPAASEPPLCDLSGHRPNSLRPAFTLCS
jgi:hypothetical protein